MAVVAAAVSQLASSSPDGLERVAADQGIEGPAADPVLADPIFADYATRGVDNAELSLAVAGLTGATLAGAVGTGVLASARRGRRAVA